MIRFALAATLAVIATPVLAQERTAAPQPANAVAEAECAVRFVHMPVTRTGHQPAVMECKRAGALETASRQPTAQERQRAVD